MKRSRGSVLVGLLWCLALLSVIVLGVLHTSRMDLLVVKNYGDRVQAHYLALAGVERAKALLYHDYLQRRQSGKNHTGSLYDDAKDFEDVAFGRGHIRVFRTDGEGGRYGISDEESRLNINTAFAGELTNLSGLTPDIAASILAWRSGVGQGANGGAEDDYYKGLQPPYVPRHGSFQTVRELLLVKDVTRADLLGGDVNQNDMMDSGAGQDGDSLPPSEGGWAAVLTAHSAEKDDDAFGNRRVNIKTADENALTGIDGISADIARAIISYRGSNQFNSIADLLDVTAPAGNGQDGQNNSGGQNMIDNQLFLRIADKVTTGDEEDVSGMININTAGEEVLACLPGMDPYLSQAIISYRRSNGYFNNVGELLNVSGMTRDIFRQMAPLITARSETFRISCEGKITSTGARQRIQVIVRILSHQIATLAYREDL